MDSLRIEICGGIASGKTTLTSALKGHCPNLGTVLEDAFSGGFLEDFYRHPRYFAYETQIFFLLQHLHQIKVEQLKNPSLVCDFSLEQDYAYAENNLNAEEWKSFQEMYRGSESQVRKPDIIIFLECPTEILLRRIAVRGQASETRVSKSYLDTTVSHLKKRLNSLSAKIITIDSNKYDFREPKDVSHIISDLLNRYIDWPD